MEANLQAVLQDLRKLGKPKTAGFVWLVNGVAEGWSADPDPTTFEPGVVFVNVQTGERLVTRGGNTYDGVTRLERLSEPGTWEARGAAWWKALTKTGRDEMLKWAEETTGQTCERCRLLVALRTRRESVREQLSLSPDGVFNASSCDTGAQHQAPFSPPHSGRGETITPGSRGNT